MSCNEQPKASNSSKRIENCHEKHRHSASRGRQKQPQRCLSGESHAYVVSIKSKRGKNLNELE